MVHPEVSHLWRSLRWQLLYNLLVVLSNPLDHWDIYALFFFRPRCVSLHLLGTIWIQFRCIAFNLQIHFLLSFWYNFSFQISDFGFLNGLCAWLTGWLIWLWALVIWVMTARGRRRALPLFERLLSSWLSLVLLWLACLLLESFGLWLSDIRLYFWVIVE